MSDIQIQLSELKISKDDGRSTIRVYRADPTPLEQKNLGTLFAVLEIDSQDSINEDILEVITSEMNRAFYASDASSVEAAFESALQKTNQKLHDVISEIGEEWLESLNILIGVQHNQELIFANLGRVIALMIHNNDVIDVLDTAKAKAQDINPVKIFSNIVSGEIPVNAVVMVATETILDYLSKEKIKRVLAASSSEAAIDEFRNLLEEDTTNANFAGLVLKQKKMHGETEEGARSAGGTSGANSTDDKIPVINRPSASSAGSLENDSMSSLVDKESQTEEFLTSSIWPRFKKSIKKSTQSITNKKPNGAQEATATEVSGEQGPAGISSAAGAKQGSSTIMNILRAIGMVILKILGFLAQLLRGIGRWLMSLFGKGRARSKSGSGGKQVTKRSLGGQRTVAGSASSGIARVLNWFKALSLVQKAFFVVAIVVLLLFAQSVVNRGEDNMNSNQEDTYAVALSDIDIKVNEAKAAALYDDEEARLLFIEARDMLAAIPTDTDIYAERGEELANVINSALGDVNNVVDLGAVSPVIDFASIDANIRLSHIILLGASMYAFDQNNTSVYRGNLENQGTTVTISDTENERTFTAVSKASPGTGVAYFSDNTFAIFNPITESLSELDLRYDNTDQSFTDVNVFGTRLYVLDQQNNQIFRHRKTGEDFSAGETWLADDAVSLASAKSITIDGNIYVLNGDGTVDRLTTGEKDNSFTLSQIDPALDSAEEIYTDEDTENVYILDTKNNRVVVFSKEGKLVSQYISASFTELVDFVVDEANSKIYLLNGTQILEIPLDGSEGEPEAAAIDESSGENLTRSKNA